ncbi:flavodoxin [bacterium]|nr:flavodoxin [bacterium]
MYKSLVAYFSATGTTKKVAENLALASDSDLFEIEPHVPYTDADLNWTNPKSRSSVEMKKKNVRPEIMPDDAQVEKYDIIFLGFPIWWYVAPRIINTFLESYNFSNKKIVLFATSGGSDFGLTVDYLLNSVPFSAQIIEGKIFNDNPTEDDLRIWVHELYLNQL